MNIRNTIINVYEFFLKVILPEDDYKNLMGDYLEIFSSIHEVNGGLQAHLWITKQLIKSIPIYTVNSLGGSMGLLKRNLLLAIRVLKKQKGYSIVNIFGLSIGLATFIFFAYMGGVHFFADKFHDKAENLFGVVQVLENEEKDLYHTTNIPAPLLTELANEFPEITGGSIFAQVPRLRIKIENEVFYEQHAFFADENFCQLFSFPFLEGDTKTALSEPGSIIISNRLSKKFFGNENALGKTLVINDSLSLKVTAVCEDLRRTSSIRFNALIDLETAKRMDGEFSSWQNNRYTGFVEISNPNLVSNINQKMKPLLSKYWDEEKGPKELYLFPILDFRLKGGDIRGVMTSTDLTIVIMIFVFGSLLLVVACFNFINLSIARYMYRTKEVGVRKVFGARRGQLIYQYLTESLLLSFVSVIIGIIIYELFNPLLVTHLRKIFESGSASNFSLSMFSNTYLFNYALMAALFTGVFSGLFPALYITKKSPVQALKGSRDIGNVKRRGTKILIVAQFVFSLVIIIASSQLKDQLYHWVHETDYGYNNSNILAVSFPSQHLDKKAVFLEELSANSKILEVSASSGLPGLWGPDTRLRLPDESNENSREAYLYGVDYNFDKVFKMKLTEGRFFDKQFKDDDNFIVNKALIDKYNFDQPIGKRIVVDDKEGTIIGVMADFVFCDIVMDVPPAVIKLEKQDVRYLLAKFHSNVEYDRLNSEVKKAWQTIFPNEPYVSTTAEIDFAETMELCDLLINMLVGMGYFSAIFSYMGLIGLVAFMLARKTKEISIRKVLGASGTELLIRLLRDYLRLIVIANIFALPLVYYLWQKFIQLGIMSTLQIQFTTLIGAMFVTILLSGLGIYIKVYKVVKINPSLTLRDE